jgi:hypothetical protein
VLEAIRLDPHAGASIARPAVTSAHADRDSASR